MKNKILITVFLSGLLISQSTYSQTSKEKSKSTNIKKSQSKKDEFDFRKIRWGMNRLQVLASEKKEPLNESEDKITFNEKMFDRDVKVNYYFENDKVIKSEYLFDGSFNTKEDYILYYQKIKSNLKSKYGKPSLDSSKELDVMGRDQYEHMAELLYRGVLMYETVWAPPGNSIKLSIKGKDFFTTLKLFVLYSSNKYKQTDETREVEKSLF